MKPTSAPVPTEPGRTEASRRPRIARAVLAALLALTLVVILLRTFVFGLYRVESGSMEPTVHGSPERLLVRYRDDWLPRRFDLVVLLLEGERDPALKRVAGLPGESVTIRGGDLLIDGRHLPLDGRPPPIPIFDERWHELWGSFSRPDVPFEREAGGWKLDARSRADAAAAPAVMSYLRKLTDDHLDARHALVPGKRSVNDALLECELAWDEIAPGASPAGGSFALVLTEEGDRFALELETLDARRVHARITRTSDGVTATLVEGDLDWERGAFRKVRFANVDNHLRFDLDRRKLLELDYDKNTPLSGVRDEAYRDLLPRAAFEARAALVRVRSIRLSRDSYYTDGGGRFATQAPVLLAQDELFVLGDNSAGSRDSREWGPVPLALLRGSPCCVVWPPRDWRSLAGDGPQEFAATQAR
jgi:signal peptidase I